MSFVLTGPGLGGELGELTTDVMVSRLPGLSKSLVRCAVAVPEDLPADAPFNVSGHAAQVYRLSDRVRFITALVPGDSPSWPRRANTLQVSVGAGTAPAEAGTYPSIDLTNFQLIVTIDGTQYVGTLAAAVHTNVVAPIGPGLRGQVGPDILRREHYLLQLKRQGVVGDGLPSDYVTVADVHIERRVDLPVLVFHVHWMNGKWRSTDNPFVPNPVCDGHVFFDALRVPTNILPAGYSYELFVQSPVSAVGATAVFGVTLPPSGEVHGIPSGSQTIFRFAMYQTSAVSQATAQRILRGHEWGRTVSGPLSYHHRHAYGGRRDLVVDLQAFDRNQAGDEIQWRDPQAPTVDVWERMDQLAAQTASTMRTNWLNGTVDTSVQFQGPRRGWHYPLGPEASGNAGGDLIYGHSLAFQARAAYEIGLMHVDALATRMGVAVIDLVDGRCCNEDKMASNNSSSWEDMSGASPGAAGKVPYVFNVQDRKANYIHPHLVPQDALLTFPWGSQNPTQYRLAPNDRAWSAPPSGKTCPYFGAINWMAVSGEGGWGPFLMSHTSRAIPPLEHAIWMYDDPVAHRILEQVACTRVMCSMSKLDAQGHIATDFGRQTATFPYMLQRMQPPFNQGWHFLDGFRFEGSNNRVFAWAAHFALMYWEVATSAERARVHPALGAAGASWFRGWMQVLGRIALPTGHVTRHDDEHGGPSPDPWSPNETTGYGPTTFASRTGALPGPTNPTGPPGLHFSSCNGFQACFCAGEAYAIKRGPMAGEPLAGEMDQTIHALPRFLAAEARANQPNSATKRPSKYPIVSIGSQGYLDPPVTLAQAEAGETRWYLFRQGSFDQLKSFQGWAGLYAYRDTEDLSMFDVVAYDHGAQPGNTTSMLLALQTALSAKWAEQNPTFRRWPMDDHTWWMGALAELIHIREGRTT